MKWMMLAALIGCRTEDDSMPAEFLGTQELTTIGDVDAMATAWCNVLACREGFEEGFTRVSECVDFYSNYWGNPEWGNNQRECFEDVESVADCTAALEATACGGETPEECVEFMACDEPDDVDTAAP
ncbi:MAG: hypothetical protein P8R54_00370 [Myxococcota bacterium]|nr:hypothetical protein [Myxococcota bacterium]